VHGHRDAALVQFQRVEALRPRLVRADDPFGLRIRTRLALLLREHGRFDEARPLLEQTVAEALRLRKTVPKRDEGVEIPLGIAEFLLKKWPGCAPGISPAERPPASFRIDVPFRVTSPVADGRIEPGEYGPGIEVTFDHDTNPGRLWTFGKSRPKSRDDLSARIHAAYTDRSLFLAFRVRDQSVSAPEIYAAYPFYNDAVDVSIDGDQVANDQTVYLFNEYQADRLGTREGFALKADPAGHQSTACADFTNADWKVGTSRTSDGYLIEFEIPLALIDTRDGPEYVSAAAGSEIRANFDFRDVDNQRLDGLDWGFFWAEDPDVPPGVFGEDFWTVSLRLVPKPAEP
jgi:hypothetical protein